MVYLLNFTTAVLSLGYLLIGAPIANAMTCWAKNESPTILLKFDDPLPDPAHADERIRVDQPFLVSESGGKNKPLIKGRLHFRGEPYLQDYVSDEREWDCDYGNFSVVQTRVPDQTRTEIANHIKYRLADPYSIRSATIGEPRVTADPKLSKIPRYYVCVSFNAKNKFGAYAGLTTWPIVYRTDVNAVWETAFLSSGACNSQDNKGPFPELGQTN